MAISPARIAAFDILLRIEREDSYASELLHSSHYQDLSSADHGLATEVVMGVLRWRPLLDKGIAEHSSQKLARLDPEVLAALHIGAYQLLFLDRVPKHAAVHESVELVKRARKRSAVPFTNAVLRKLADAAQHFDVNAAIAEARTEVELADSSAHPLWLVERWIQQFGFEVARQICAYNQQIPETAIRIADSTVADELLSDQIQLEPGHLLSSARRVVSGDLTGAPSFRNGRVAIQDEASQLVSLLVGHGANILDGCAAPGGKTRILAQCNPTARIVASDLHPHRARMLRKLVLADNVHVIAADIRKPPFSECFDRVLTDVPCSGTGTIARNPEIKWKLKPEDLADLQARQLAILQSAMRCVSRGGKLVYSTCSLECEENSAVVERALSADDSFRLLDCRGELGKLLAEGELRRADVDSLLSGAYLRTIPGVHPCDGFFAAILEKS